MEETAEDGGGDASVATVGMVTRRKSSRNARRIIEEEEEEEEIDEEDEDEQEDGEIINAEEGMSVSEKILLESNADNQKEVRVLIYQRERKSCLHPPYIKVI